MELDDYIRASLRHRWLIGLTALIALIASFALARFSPTTYDTSVAFTVRRINEPATTQYQYDGFYVLQATDLIAQTIVSWFGTPSIVREIYLTAGFDPSIKKMDEITRRFQPKKFSAQNVVLRFNDDSSDTALKLATAIQKNVSERVQKLVLTADEKPSFEVLTADPVIVEKKPDVIQSSILGAIAGLIIGLFLAAAVEGVKRSGT